MAASIQQILNYRDANRLPIPDNIRTAADTSRGITDEIYQNNVVSAVDGGDVPEWFRKQVVRSEEPVMPTIDIITGFLKIPGKSEKEKREKFIKDFPKKANEWKELVTKDPKFGDRGWETVRNVWRQASIDKMNQDIVDERKRIVSGDDNGFLSKGGMTAAKIFRPRAYEAWERGEDPTWKDNVGDAAENVLYSLPFVGGAGRVLGAIPKVARFSRMPSVVIGNAIAPTATEAIDAAMRGEDDPNMDRRDFSAGDAIIGTATNMGINQKLYRTLGRAVPFVTGKIGRAGAGVRNFLENLGRSSTERGREAVARSADIVRGGYTPEGFIQPSVVLGAASDVPAVGQKEFMDATLFKDFASNIDKLNPISAKDLAKMEANNAPGVRGASVKEVIDHVSKGAGDDVKATVTAVLSGPYAGDAMNLLKGSRGMNKAEKARDLANVGVGNIISNKTGDNLGDEVADFALGGVGSLFNKAGSGNASSAIKKLRKEEKEETRRRQGKSEISKILSAGADSLNDTDRMYLKALKEKPELMTVGFEDQSQNDAFKMWLLDRGNSILRGTAISRPVWSVE